MTNHDDKPNTDGFKEVLNDFLNDNYTQEDKTNFSLWIDSFNNSCENDTQQENKNLCLNIKKEIA